MKFARHHSFCPYKFWGFTATVFYKIFLGRQPRLVIQVHRRWREWLRLHPRHSVDISITCSGSLNSTVNFWSLSAKSLGDCKYLPSCRIGCTVPHQLPLKRNHCLSLRCCHEIWNANLHVTNLPHSWRIRDQLDVTAYEACYTDTTPTQSHRNSNTHWNKDTRPMWWYNRKVAGSWWWMY